MYHSFNSTPPLVIRQIGGWEAPYDRVKRVRTSDKTQCSILIFLLGCGQLLPRRDDLTPLTDATFIAKILTEMPSEASQHKGASTGWRGLGTKIDVAILDKPPP
jgi:type 2A phosphatase activator TIP41